MMLAHSIFIRLLLKEEILLIHFHDNYNKANSVDEFAYRVKYDFNNSYS